MCCEGELVGDCLDWGSIQSLALIRLYEGGRCWRRLRFGKILT